MSVSGSNGLMGLLNSTSKFNNSKNKSNSTFSKIDLQELVNKAFQNSQQELQNSIRTLEQSSRPAESLADFLILVRKNRQDRTVVEGVVNSLFLTMQAPKDCLKALFKKNPLEFAFIISYSQNKTLLETVVSEIITEQPEDWEECFAEVVEKILDNFNSSTYKLKTVKKIVGALPLLPFFKQLDSAVLHRMAQILLNDLDTLADWVNKLVTSEENIEDALEWIKTMTLPMDSNKFDDFLAILEKTASPCIPYLFLGVSHKHLDQLLLVGRFEVDDKEMEDDEIEDSRLPKALFHSALFSKVSSESPQIKKVIQYLFEDEKMRSLVLSNFRMAIRPDSNMEATALTMHDVRYNLSNAIKNDMVSMHIEMVKTIPPFFIGLTTLSKDYEKLYLEVVNHFTDDQLKMFVMFIPAASISSYFNQIVDKLSHDQIRLVFLSFSKEQAKQYLQANLSALEKRLEFALGQSERIPKNLEMARQYFGNLSRESFDELYKEVFSFQMIVNESLNCLHLELIKAMVKHPNWVSCLTIQQEIKFSAWQETFRKLQNQLRGPSSFIAQLEEIESLAGLTVEEYDPFDSIDEWIWLLLRQEHLKALNLTGAGEIIDVGLRFTKDFELLGLSKESHKQMSRLRELIKKISYDYITDKDVFENKLQHLFSLNSEKNSQKFLELAEELVLSLNIKERVKNRQITHLKDHILPIIDQLLQNTKELESNPRVLEEYRIKILESNSDLQIIKESEAVLVMAVRYARKHSGMAGKLKNMMESKIALGDIFEDELRKVMNPSLNRESQEFIIETQNLVENLKLKKRVQDGQVKNLREDVLSIIDHILKNGSNLSHEYQNLLKEYQKNIKKASLDLEVIEKCEKSLLMVINYLKAEDLLTKLCRYLTQVKNETLKEIWKILNGRGFKSIADLCQSGTVQRAEELYQLQTILDGDRDEEMIGSTS